MALIKGLEIELGGEKRVVPPLNLNSIEDLEDDINALSTKISMREQMRISRRIVHAALARNYPDVTTEQVGDWLDLGNVNDVVFAVLGQSGFNSASGGAGGSSAEGGEPKK